MRLPLVMTLGILLVGHPATAQETDVPNTPPEAAAADVESLDAILTALYDAISGPAGPRDWDRFRSLFAPDARLIPTGRDSAGTARLRVWSPDEYAERAAGWFADNAFYEIEVSRTTETFGQLVHAFSTYESRNAPDADPFVRGINSIQVLDDGSRWWIVSIMWADERSAGEIPTQYLGDDERHGEHH